MRRLLLVVLALVLPLKAVAVGVVPIVGAPWHLHVAAHTAAQVSVDLAHDGCDAHGAEVPTAGDAPFGHACPHVGMAFVAPAPAAFEPDRFAPRAPCARAANFVSVVLDVPLPPPNRRA